MTFATAEERAALDRTLLIRTGHRGNTHGGVAAAMLNVVGRAVEVRA
jgi:acyl-coenzyme A thioesterase PaaI-like protein